LLPFDVSTNDRTSAPLRDAHLAPTHIAEYAGNVASLR